MKFPALTIRKLGVAALVGAALTLGLFGQVATASGPGPGGGGPGGGSGPGGGGGYITPLPCSVSALAAAITDRNNGGTGVILLASWCDYKITTPATALDGLPAITGTVVIQGGINSTISRDPNTDAIFRILEVAANGNLTIKNVAIENGNAGAANSGGGILTNTKSTLTVMSSTFAGNQASAGGAIAVVAGTATITDSTFSNNSAINFGGGAIFLIGPSNLIMNNSHILNNQAPVDGGGMNIQPGSKATLNSTEVRLNTTGSAGGGIAALGTLTMNGGRITGNTASIGGGIAGNSRTTLNGVLIFGNTPDNCAPANTIAGCFN